MNVSAAFKQLTTKQYELTARERLMVIIAIGIIVLVITLYMSTSEAIIESVVPSSTVVTTTIQEPLSTPSQAIPVPTGGDQPIRDPFAKPPEVKEQNIPAATAGPKSYNNAPNSKPAAVPGGPKSTTASGITAKDLKLTGIATGNKQGFAVIMSGGKSKTYGIHDSIGAYRIVAINSDHVILASNTNKIVLRLESVSQKEGKASDK